MMNRSLDPFQKKVRLFNARMSFPLLRFRFGRSHFGSYNQSMNHNVYPFLFWRGHSKNYTAIKFFMAHNLRTIKVHNALVARSATHERKMFVSIIRENLSVWEKKLLV